MKKSKKMMIIGGILLAIGIVITVIGFNNVMNTSIGEGFGSVFFVFIGFAFDGAGLICLSIGVMPHLTKGMMKIHKETLDMAGDDITAMGENMVDIEAPVMKKRAKVMTPIVEDMAEAVSSGIKKGLKGEEKFCTNCGEGGWHQ